MTSAAVKNIFIDFNPAFNDIFKKIDKIIEEQNVIVNITEKIDRRYFGEFIHCMQFFRSSRYDDKVFKTDELLPGYIPKSNAFYVFKIDFYVKKYCEIPQEIQKIIGKRRIRISEIKLFPIEFINFKIINNLIFDEDKYRYRYLKKYDTIIEKRCKNLDELKEIFDPIVKTSRILFMEDYGELFI